MARNRWDGHVPGNLTLFHWNTYRAFSQENHDKSCIAHTAINVFLSLLTVTQKPYERPTNIQSFSRCTQRHIQHLQFLRRRGWILLIMYETALNRFFSPHLYLSPLCPSPLYLFAPLQHIPSNYPIFTKPLPFR